MNSSKEITLYLNEPVFFKIGEKPITKYNLDHKINLPYIDKVIEDMIVYNAIHQVKVWFENTLIEFHDVTWSKEDNW